MSCLIPSFYIHLKSAFEGVLLFLSVTLFPRFERPSGSEGNLGINLTVEKKMELDTSAICAIEPVVYVVED